jgi:hypothetical protein
MKKSITRSDDPLILSVKRLLDRCDAREREQRFWCEGLRFVHQALQSPFDVSLVLAAPELFVGQMG